MLETLVRPDVKAFLDMIAAAPAVKMSDAGPVEARAMMRSMGEHFDEPAGDLELVRDLEMPSPSGGTIRLRLFDRQLKRDPGPAILFLHGGGFVLGDLDGYQSACAEIARAIDMPVIAVDYRLAPEHPWPAAPDDCEAAARWVAASPACLGRLVTGLVIAGDSAGGALTIVTTMALRDRPASAPVLAQWPIYPVTDLAGDYPSREALSAGYMLELDQLNWFYEQYAADSGHWRASPIVGDQAGMPPTLVVTSAFDPLRDEGRAYAAAAVRAGVRTTFREVDGMIHGFLNFRRAIPSAVEDFHACIEALDAIVSEAATPRKGFAS